VLQGKGVKEQAEAERDRRTLLRASFDLRFSWFLSRRLRNRETPCMVMSEKVQTHPGTGMAATLDSGLCSEAGGRLAAGYVGLDRSRVGWVVLGKA
jgi:hypothetical protein